MEEELRCPCCKEVYSSPVLLPCWHALCLACALGLQAPQEDETDKASVLSETDSGVVCTGSRPGSYVGPATPTPLPPAPATLALACPVCHKTVYFDEKGAHNLPRYRAMANLVERVVVGRCELCEGRAPSVYCEQCRLAYCSECRDSCHPARGALARHSLSGVAPRTAERPPSAGQQSPCPEHPSLPLSLYCLLCKAPACPACHHAKHPHHDTQPALPISKAQKTELSQNLQQLSEKARSTTEFIQRLKSMTDRINESSLEFEAGVREEVGLLVRGLEARGRSLLELVRAEREAKVRRLREQVTSCTAKLQHTTALIQFCIEALKETDATAFLQIGSMLISRVAAEDLSWQEDAGLSSPRVSPNCDLTLDTKPLLRAIEQLNFIQMKPPNAPVILPEECSAENNSVTVAWQPPPTSYVEGYVLELDDGNGGEFREVYCGKETICTVDGLHFNSMYNARVKAFNGTGEGDYSELIGLQTAEVAWFTLDSGLGGPDLSYSEDSRSVTCEGYEHRVALGSVGFSRGVHYWEFSVDRYEADTDPSFGVARLDVAKDHMLGKDDKGWSMYIDRQRSWFMHANIHDERCEGGIQQGSTVGVLLDLDRHQLSFYVNEEPHGPIAFHNLYGVFYPAVSLNRGVTVTIHTALELPPEVEDT